MTAGMGLWGTKWIADAWRGLHMRMAVWKQWQTYKAMIDADAETLSRQAQAITQLGAPDMWRTDPIKSALEITRRCQGAEYELKRVTLRLAKLQAERAQERELAGPPWLTPAEIERLGILAEECGETIQAVGKVLRHGWESQSPYGGVPNRVNLEREVGNVRAAVNLMLDAEDLRLNEVQTWQRAKRAGLCKWTHHQADSMPREQQLAMMREIELRQGLER